MKRRYTAYIWVGGILLFLYSMQIFSIDPQGEIKQNWKQTTIVVPHTDQDIASKVLLEEVKKRTGFEWTVSKELPEEGNVILLQTGPPSGKIAEIFDKSSPLPHKPESYRISNKVNDDRSIILIEGYDKRGTLFGAGRLLRLMQLDQGHLVLNDFDEIIESPEVPVRGHQLGYRNTANSYDGWTPEFYEQYIRELVIFGANSIETIPFAKESPHFTLPPRGMNVHISNICEQYDLDYWVWTPADFDLKDKSKKEDHLKETEQLYKDLPRLDAVFFPGGDPGDNPPELVLPFLESLAQLLNKYHPDAKIWLSLQGFSPEMSQYVYDYINNEMPEWLGGLVAGPSSPPLEETREALPEKYGLRHYPDITHTVRCQYPLPWWDPAFNFTLGREPVNPQPYFYTDVYRRTFSYTDGFITYSDGAHDDVNKMIWSMLGWSSKRDVKEMVKEYASFFYGSHLADEAANAIIGLEKNWEGVISENQNIESTIKQWENLQNKKPELDSNWRWQMHMFRASYDSYTQQRASYEADLEQQANEVLLKAEKVGADQAIKEAKNILARADKSVNPELRDKIIALGENLFKSVRLQTSVEKYKARNSERGAVLDFLDRPLNNRWWLEDELNRIATYTDDDQKISELKKIGQWENPGPGSFYDDIGNPAKSPHVIRGENSDIPGFDWWDKGYSRERLSWMVSMRWPDGLSYKNLDPEAEYLVRATGYGECLLRANGVRLEPTVYGKGVGEIKEFPLSKDLISNGELLLTFDPINEDHLNWRQHSRLTEVWLIKKTGFQ